MSASNIGIPRKTGQRRAPLAQLKEVIQAVSHRVFCPECDEERLPRIDSRRETLIVRGEPQEVTADVAVCPVCREDLVDAAHDDHTLVSAYNAYRQRHGLLLPHEIRQLRERYRLSQRLMAQIVGLDLATLQRYESGALQTDAHETLLRRLADPQTAHDLATRHRNHLSPRQWALFKEGL